VIKPVKKNQELLDEINSIHNPNTLNIWWLGQSGFLVKSGGKTVLLDPYLSDSLTIKYRDTDKPHTRMSELVINPNLLTGIDIVTSSHNHTDHLDADTLIPILTNNSKCTFIIPEANRAFVVERIKCELGYPLGMSGQEDEVTIDNIKIIALPAAHNTIEKDELGNCKYLSYIININGYTLYHSGDTLWYDGLEDLLRPYQIDIAFLPINGNKPERKVAGNLNYMEAAALAKAIKAKLCIPHHYDMFAFNTENPAHFVNAAKMMNVPYKEMLVGERYKYYK
jgi:L-ascorbate metabolism protein UlaG (beta-lactamase superfamily)